MAVQRNTPSSQGQQIHELDIRVSLMEDRYKRIDDKLDRIVEGMSGQGRPPTPKGRAKPKDDGSDEDAKPRGWGLREGTGREVVTVVGAVILLISSVVGAVQSVRNGANASNAALEGAQQAIEEAVEQADVVPMAAPVIVPQPVPVPVPVPAATPADVGAAEAGGLSSEILPSRAAED